MSGMEAILREWRCTCGETRHSGERRDNPDCPWHHGVYPANAPECVKVAIEFDRRIGYRGHPIERAEAYIRMLDLVRAPTEEP